MALPRAGQIPSVAVAALFAAFWGLYSRAPVGVEADFWWHLKAGQLILDGHAPFTTDPFSFTMAGKPWMQHEWLGEVVLAWLHGAGGVDAVRFWYWALMLLSFGLVGAVFGRAGCSPAVSAFGALAVHLHLYAQLWPRMQGFTLVGMAATALLLQNRWAGGRLGPAVWLYPAGVAFWANLHGGALAGPLSCTLALLPELPGAIHRRDGARLLPMVAMTALSWLALTATPAGPGLLSFVWATITNAEYRAMYALVAEWGPFRWDYSTCQHFVLWGMFLGACALLAGRGRPAPAGAWALAVPWAVMAVLSRRHLPIAGVASAPLAAWLLAGAIARYGTAGQGPRRAFAGVAALLACGMVLPPVLDLLSSRAFQTGLRWPSGPALTAALREARAGRRMLNLYDWGGLLIFHGYPEAKVFIDGRQDAYGLELNLAHNRLLGTVAGWEGDLARWRIDAVFAPPEAPLVSRLLTDPKYNHTWKAVHQDPSAVVLLKDKPAITGQD